MQFLALSHFAWRDDAAARVERSRKASVVQLAGSPGGGCEMSLGAIILVLLILAFVGVLPTWGYSSSWGYGPTGGVGLIVVIVVVLLLMGRV